MTKSPLFICAMLLSVFPLTADEAVRNWTNTSGKTISAELVDLVDGVAKLKLSNGREYDVSLDTLSQSDRDYAAAWIEAREAAARAGEMNVELSVPTEAIVESTFEGNTPPTRKGEVGGWKAGIGEWRIEEGVLIGDELPEDNHASSLTYSIEALHLIIRAEVQLGTAESIAFACRDDVPPSLHLGRLYITPDKLWIQKMEGIAKTTKAEKLVTEEVEIDPEVWYDVTIEIVGENYRAQVGDYEIKATHPRFSDGKATIALVNKGQGAKYRNVSLWHAEPKD